MTTATTSVYEALLAVQQEMTAIELQKTGINPHFGNKYIPLEELITKVVPILNKHGLALMQMPAVWEGHPALTTTLIYGDGTRIESNMLLLCAKEDPQGQGSAITYARRYSLMAMLGLSADADDDGEKATQSAQRAPQSRPQPRGGIPRPEVNGEPVPPPTCPEHGSMAYVKAGTSKAGKPYPAFYSCPERRNGCTTKTADAGNWAAEYLSNQQEPVQVNFDEGMPDER